MTGRWHQPRTATTVAVLGALALLASLVVPAHGATVPAGDRPAAEADLLVPLGLSGAVVAGGEVIALPVPEPTSDRPVPRSSPWAAVLGPGGLVHVSDAGTGTVTRFDPAAGSPRFETVLAGADGGLVPRGLAVDGAGHLLVVDAGAGRVLRVAPGTDLPAQPGIEDGAMGGGVLVDPVAIVVDADGTVLVSDRGDDDIERFDPATGAHLGTLANLGAGAAPAGLAWRADGVLLVALTGRGSVVPVDPVTGSVGRPLVADLDTPEGLAVDAGGTLWVADSWNDTVTAHDPSTGRPTGDQLTLGADRGPRLIGVAAGRRAVATERDGPPVTAPGPRTGRWLDGLPRPARGVAFVTPELADGPDDDVDAAALTTGYDAVLVDGDVVLVADGVAVADALTMTVVGGSDEPVSELLDRSPIARPTGPAGETIGGDRGATGQAVEFRQVLPGIDVVYSADGDHLEYSFVIDPGADPDRIDLAFDGVAGLEIDDAGDLVIDASAGPGFVSTAPVTYQWAGDVLEPVDSAYLVRPDGTVGFRLGPYDPDRPVVIDPTFVANTTAGGTFISGSTLDLPVPAGVTAGELLIAQVAYNAPDPASIAPPAGWTVIDVVDHPTEALIQGLYWRAATGSEPAQYSFTLTAGGTGKASGAIGTYSGVDLGAPIDAFGAQSATGTTITAPSITTTQPGTTLIGFFAGRDAGPITGPAGMTERWEASSGGGGPDSSKTVAEAADEQLVAAGPTGSRTATIGPVQGNIGHLVALAPAGACPTGDADGDGLCDDQEDADTDADGDPATNPGPDTDGDTLPNYLDADDDGDGTPTAAENPDPNGDGDPRDALDADHDGQARLARHPGRPVVDAGGRGAEDLRHHRGVQRCARRPGPVRSLGVRHR